jgi:hypothetical protein
MTISKLMIMKLYLASFPRTHSQFSKPPGNGPGDEVGPSMKETRELLPAFHQVSLMYNILNNLTVQKLVVYASKQ